MWFNEVSQHNSNLQVRPLGDPLYVQCNCAEYTRWQIDIKYVTISNKDRTEVYHSEVLRWNEVSYRVVIMLPLFAIKKSIDWLLNMYRELDTSNSIGIKQLLLLWVFRKLKYIAFDESIILTNPKKKSNQCILIMLKKKKTLLWKYWIRSQPDSHIDELWGSFQTAR